MKGTTGRFTAAASGGALLAAVIGLALVAAPLFAEPGAPVSPVIFPEQRIPLHFSHAQHLALPGQPGCERCHEQAAGSRSSLDNLIPREAACAGCHVIDRAVPDKVVAAGEPAARCVACHPGFAPGTAVARVEVPAPNLKFNHALHVKEQGMGCTGCHGDLTGVGLATRAALPSMALCLGCHDGKQARSECVTCHLAGPGGRLQTGFTSGVLAPSGALFGAAHDLSFATRHGFAAQNNGDFCARCHGKRFCVDCHNGAARPMDFHGNDYVTLHGPDARNQVLDCGTCHRAQTFCTGCHSRSGVTADARVSEFAGNVPERRFHPDGWSGGQGMSGHGAAARQNLRECASCHREQFCVTCHSAEADNLGQNPHPPGFGKSRRCRSLLSRNSRVCLRCHVGPGEARCE